MKKNNLEPASQISMAIKRLLKRSGLTQGEIAQFIGISQSTISKWQNGKQEPTTLHWQKMKELALMHNLLLPNIEDIFLTGGKSGVIRVMGKVGAGAEVIQFDNGVLEEVSSDWQTPKLSYAAIVHGKSMVPFYKDGDLIGFGAEVLTPDQAIGELCILYTEDGRTLVKFVERGSAKGLYNLVSINGPTMEDVALQWARLVEFHLKKSAIRKI